MIIVDVVFSFTITLAILPQWQMGAQEDAHGFLQGLLHVVGTNFEVLIISWSVSFV